MTGVIYIRMHWLWMNIKNNKQCSGMNEWRPDGKATGEFIIVPFPNQMKAKRNALKHWEKEDGSTERCREAELWIWSILLVYELKNWCSYPFLDKTAQGKRLSVFDKCAMNKWVEHASESTLRTQSVTCIILHSIWSSTALEANPDEH